MNAKWKLIYFDDQIPNIECFQELLSEKFNVIGSNDPNELTEMLQGNNPHAFLLDIHMPKLNGHVLYEKIINHALYNGCPIFFISGDQSDETKVRAYSEGVDFLPRDLKPAEIIIRLTNKVKLYLATSTKLELGNLVVDVKHMTASVDQKTADLTLLEFRILSSILRIYPASLTRAELIFKVWGTDSVKPGTINTHLTNLKPKIESWDHNIKVREENVLIQKKIS